MSSFAATFLVADFVLCAAWMAYWFRIHQYPSLVGFTSIIVLLRYGVMAISYANDPYLPFPVPETFPYFLAATLTFFVVGATVASMALRFDLPASQRTFFEQPAEQPTAVSVPMFAVIFIATMVVGIYFVTATERTGIEMLVSYSGEQQILRTYREQFGANNPYGYAGTVISHVVGPMLLMVAANLWKSNARLLWGMAGLGMLGLLVFTSTASLNKGPIIVVILYILTNRFLSKWRGRQISKTALIIPVAALFGLGTLGYALTYGDTAANALADTVDRIFVAPLVSVHGYLHVYPNIVPFSNGLGIGLIAKLFDVPNFMPPDSTVGMIIAGPYVGVNTIWSGDLWANFGWAGVIVGSAFVGVVLLFLDRWCLVRKRTAVTVALYAFMLVSSTVVTEVSIFTMLLSGGLVTAPLLAWLLEKADAGRQASRGPQTGSPRGTGHEAKRLPLSEGVSGS